MSDSDNQSGSDDEGDDPPAADAPFFEFASLLYDATRKYGTTLADFKRYGGIQRPQRSVRAYLAGTSAPSKAVRLEQVLISIKGITDSECDAFYDAWERARLIRQHLRLTGSAVTIATQLTDPTPMLGCEFEELNRLIQTMRRIRGWEHPHRPFLLNRALATISRITDQIHIELGDEHVA
jgi:hypothetical protein